MAKPESIARRGRKRRPKPMDVRTLSRVLTTAITALEDDLLKATDPEEKRRSASVLAQLAGVYTKVNGEQEWQQSLADLRRELNDATASPRRTQGAGAHARTPAAN